MYALQNDLGYTKDVKGIWMTWNIVLSQWIYQRDMEFNFDGLSHAQMIGWLLLLCCMFLEQAWTRGNSV